MLGLFPIVPTVGSLLLLYDIVICKAFTELLRVIVTSNDFPYVPLAMNNDE